MPISREIKNIIYIDIENTSLCIFLTATHMCEIPGILCEIKRFIAMNHPFYPVKDTDSDPGKKSGSGSENLTF